MTIYVDDVVRHPSGPWCHMATDAKGKAGEEELHSFAARIGLKSSWFQRHRLVDHYDLRPSKRTRAVELGAVPVKAAELLRTCQSSATGHRAASQARAQPAHSPSPSTPPRDDENRTTRGRITVPVTSRGPGPSIRQTDTIGR